MIETVRKIPLDAIVDPPYQGNHDRFNPFDEKHASLLAQEIAKEGVLLHPITVRPGHQEGTFFRIAGRHRQWAVANLGWTEIEAKVIEGISDQDAEWLTLVENMLRSDLAGPAVEGETKQVRAVRAGIHRDQMVLRAAQIYEEQHPEAAEIAEAARKTRAGEEGAASKITPANRKRDDQGRVSGPPQEDGSRVKTAAQHIAKETGSHPETVRRQIKRASAFTPKETKVLADHAVTQKEQDRIAALEEKGRRVAITQIEAGSSIDEAVEIGTKVARGEIDLPEPGKKPEGPPPEEKLTDEEWLASVNPDVRDRAVRSYFDYFALLWRRTSDVRGAFAKRLQREKTALTEIYGDVQAGSKTLEAVYNRALGIAHPKDWRTCGGCSGKGCKDCDMAGFTVPQAPRVKPQRPKAAPKAVETSQEPAGATPEVKAGEKPPKPRKPPRKKEKAPAGTNGKAEEKQAEVV